MADIFREVDEDVRRDELLGYWRRYGKYAVAVAVVFVLSVAGFTFLKQYNERQRQAASAAFEMASAQAQADKAGEAASAFQTLADTYGGGYAQLARLRAARAQVAAGDRDGALRAFDAIAADSSVEGFLRDLARLEAAALLVDAGDPAAVEAHLAPLLAEGAPLRPLARELQALLALRQGDTAKAGALYQELAADAASSPGLRLRASELAEALGTAAGGAGEPTAADGASGG
jgi:hypothetical protein